MRQCFAILFQIFIGGSSSPYCSVLHYLNFEHQILSVPDIECCQYVAVRTAVLRISGIQNGTNEAKYKICKTKSFKRVVALILNKNHVRIQENHIVGYLICTFFLMISG